MRLAHDLRTRLNSGLLLRDTNIGFPGGPQEGFQVVQTAKEVSMAAQLRCQSAGSAVFRGVTAVLVHQTQAGLNTNIE